jgi:hydroxymethylpyrimidine pyrophosphatase-like HAD family hydrolase
MEPGYPVLHDPPPDSRVEDVARLADRGAVKLLARHPSIDADAFLEAVEAAVGGRVVATRSAAGSLVELSAAGVTKATTLAMVCERFGVDARDVVAFGDMPNDLAMLAWAGRSFAVADAHPALDAVVTDHAGPHDEDGVAVALEELFDL